MTNMTHSHIHAPLGRPSRARAGFTLIELMAVMVILGLLTFFVLRGAMGAEETVRVNSTRGYLLQLSAAIDNYEPDAGDYPPSSFPRSLDPKPSDTNMGAEMLVISLWPKQGSVANAPAEDRLVNTDGDRTSQSHTMFSAATAFELADDWGNPIAYFHRRDYDEPCIYVTVDEEGYEQETRVQALINPVTGDPYNKTSFQLLSAGSDGIFGNDDDLGNFKIQEADFP